MTTTISDNMINNNITSNILYTYDNIDHITNRSKFNIILKKFLVLCDELDIVVIEEKTGSCMIMSKMYILNMITELRKKMVKIQIDELQNLDTGSSALRGSITLKYIECICEDHI